MSRQCLLHFIVNLKKLNNRHPIHRRKVIRKYLPLFRNSIAASTVPVAAKIYRQVRGEIISCVLYKHVNTNNDVSRYPRQLAVIQYLAPPSHIVLPSLMVSTLSHPPNTNRRAIADCVGQFSLTIS